MMHTKPSQAEEEFIAREEASKKKKLSQEIHAVYEQQEKQKLKDIHWMHCPKCGMEMQSLLYRGVVVDKCFSCGGVFLDNGELEKILDGEEEGIFSSIVSLFK